MASLPAHLCLPPCPSRAHSGAIQRQPRPPDRQVQPGVQHVWVIIVRPPRQLRQRDGGRRHVPPHAAGALHVRRPPDSSCSGCAASWRERDRIREQSYACGLNAASSESEAEQAQARNMLEDWATSKILVTSPQFELSNLTSRCAACSSSASIEAQARALKHSKGKRRTAVATVAAAASNQGCFMVYQAESRAQLAIVAIGESPRVNVHDSRSLGGGGLRNFAAPLRQIYSRSWLNP